MEFETLATGYGLVEGPRTDEQNRLYYSEVRGGGVFRRSPRLFCMLTCLGVGARMVRKCGSSSHDPFPVASGVSTWQLRGA